MTDRDLMTQALDALERYQVKRQDFDRFADEITALRERLAQPEQEPVAWMTPDGEGFRIRFSPPVNDVPLGWDALYTSPPQRKPLSDEWIHRTTILMGFNPEWTTEIGIAHAIVRAAEAAHGIKENT